MVPFNRSGMHFSIYFGGVGKNALRRKNLAARDRSWRFDSPCKAWRPASSQATPIFIMPTQRRLEVGQNKLRETQLLNVEQLALEFQWYPCWLRSSLPKRLSKLTCLTTLGLRTSRQPCSCRVSQKRTAQGSPGQLQQNTYSI